MSQFIGYGWAFYTYKTNLKRGKLPTNKLFKHKYKKPQLKHLHESSMVYTMALTTSTILRHMQTDVSDHHLYTGLTTVSLVCHDLDIKHTTDTTGRQGMLKYIISPLSFLRSVLLCLELVFRFMDFEIVNIFYCHF